MTKTDSRNDKLRAAHDKLQEAVAEIVSGDEWKRMLQVASKFHKYSFSNILLIQLQKPDATLVAGFNKWKSLGRTVMRGEKGIAILAPCKYKIQPPENGPSAASPGGGEPRDPRSSSSAKVAASVGRPTAGGQKVEDAHGDEQAVQQLRGFRVVHVFDAAQTEGEPIESFDAVRPKLLDGDAPEGIWDALVSQASKAGFEVVRNRRGSENGYCDFGSARIGIRPDVEGLQAIKTLIHELAHALLHSDELPTSREIAEVEVESVAYIVCDAVGMDTSDYSFAYVARWSGGETELIKDTAERVVEYAKQILQSLEVSETSSEMDQESVSR